MIPAALLACAAHVAPSTVAAIIRVESGGDPLALNVNGLPAGRQPHPVNRKAAVAQAERFIEAGYSVDLGLMQVNSRNLLALGQTVASMLDPCTNVRSGATILGADYAEAAQRFGKGQHALQAALSAYNTGTFWRGFENGYVARFYRRTAIPTVRVVASSVSQPPAASNPYAAGITVYQRETSHVRIID